ncbi:hypothetical protein LC087_15755 [Bacillus carboniphilus]|uniref:DUF3885 domain-containing protein n=1 Tax=Bacillus carboniphilus TaxID=86663 RepID=A0ABY9JS60_9BACI|nr:hypothetical protein [Bacillus carboniphilus]WLR42177.1 hypothetical protein LC087_15755 [Bacillus carboniphilus]
MTIKELNYFLNNHFDDLVLRPPLFHLWDIGIRFDIADSSLDFFEEKNISQMYKRTLTLHKTSQ